MKLRTRFALLICFAGACLFALFSVTVYYQVKQRTYTRAEQLLVGHIQHEREHFDTPHSHHRDTNTPFKEIFLQVVRNGTILHNEFSPGETCGPRDGIFWTQNKIYYGMSDIEQDSVFHLCGYYDLGSTHAYFSSLRRVLAGVCFFAFCFLIPFSLATSSYLLRPFARLAQYTESLSAERLSFRFRKPKVEDEFGLLITGFNHLLERLEKSFGLLRRFADNASHELKTPLAVIIAQGEIALRRERTPEEYRASLEAMTNAAKQMKEITERLLFLADTQAIRPENMPYELDVVEELSQAEAAIRTRYPDSTLKITLHPCAGGKALVNAQPELLRSVIGNIVENSFKYSKERLDIFFKKTPTHWGIVFEDDGPGIPVHLRNKIFDPFVKVDPASKKGHGLGLSIVKAAVEAMRGKISLGDSIFGGLRVVIDMPAAQAVS